MVRGLGSMIQGLASQLGQIAEKGLVTGEADAAEEPKAETADEPEAAEEPAAEVEETAEPQDETSDQDSKEKEE